jgi:hypothetical protein
MNRTRTTLAIGLLAALVCASPLAHADDDEEKRKDAQVFFDTGVDLARTGDAKGALSAFRSAYEMYPNFRVLYNIGQLCARLGDGACAVRSYEQYLRDGGRSIPAKRRAAVESEIQALSRTLAGVTVTVDAPGAEIRIDDEVVGVAPLPGPVAVSAGDHVVAAVHAGRRAEKRIQVVSGDSASVELELPEEAPAAPEGEGDGEKDAEPAEAVAKESPPRPFPVVPWAVTGGLAVATGVVAVLAISAHGRYQDTRDSFPISRGELDDAHGSARDLFLAASALGVVTLVSAGVATYMTLSSGPSAPEKKSAARPRVALAPGLGGLSLVGTWP